MIRAHGNVEVLASHVANLRARARPHRRVGDDMFELSLPLNMGNGLDVRPSWRVRVTQDLDARCILPSSQDIPDTYLMSSWIYVPALQYRADRILKCDHVW